MTSAAIKERIARDQQLVTALGATGTPAFFINGRKLAGAYPFDAFKPIIDEELAKAEALVKAGTPAAQVYATIIARGTSAPAPAAGNAPQGQPAAPQAVYRKVPVKPDDPVLGAATAPVTVVVFSDFQCPFCARVEPSLKQLGQEYAGKVRFVWKHQPLPMHPNAVPAAIAAEAAREQGKFWEMHDKLFAAQQDLTPATYERYAQELKLDMGKFKASVAASKGQARISADQDLARSVGVNGTPTMFFNCRQVVGAVPYPNLKTVMDEELKKADALLQGGKAGPGFYQKACDANLAAAPAAAAPAADEPAAPAPSVTPDALGLRADDPVRGNAKAPVTLVLFSDFQCPFCGRIEPTISQVEQTYGNKVKVVWKHQPLPMHPQAIPAAEAAEAAREQGKFWEMHDKLFQNQQALSPDVYAKLAKELGLDMTRFEAARQSGRGRARIQQDQAVANRIGVGGTPTLFVNGERVVGAVPFETLKAVIDRQLARK
jgi:protein-disulfide isomerase